MELLESIQKSLVEQNRKQDFLLFPSTNKNYISLSLFWNGTSEGGLFWRILDCSYCDCGTYDYLTIIKLYLIYGAEVFKLIIHSDYRKYYSGTDTLTSKGFEYLCEQIERNGIVRKH